MPEQYANLAKTFLTADYTAGDGTIHVDSTGAPFPTAASFTLAITNPTETTIKVLLRVSAISSSTQWTVTAEGTDASASNGDHVIGPWWSRDAIDGIRADIITKGTYASLPSSADKKKGDWYNCTDSKFKFHHDGSNWLPVFEDFYCTVPPAVSGLTWVNQGSATTDETKGGILLHVPSSGSADVKALIKSIPGGSYTFDIGYTVQAKSTNYGIHGIFIRDSNSAKVIIAGNYNDGICVYKFNSVTSPSGPYVQHDNVVKSSKMFMRVVDSGGNFVFYWSVDGVFWDQLYSVSRTDWLAAPDQIGICGDIQNSFLASLWFFHWTGV